MGTSTACAGLLRSPTEGSTEWHLDRDRRHAKDVEQLHHVLGDVDLLDEVAVVDDEEVGAVPGHRVTGLERPAGSQSERLSNFGQVDSINSTSRQGHSRRRRIVLAHDGFGLPADGNIVSLGHPMDHLELECLPARTRELDELEEGLDVVDDDRSAAVGRRMAVDVELDVLGDDLVCQREITAPECQVVVPDPGEFFARRHLAGSAAARRWAGKSEEWKQKREAEHTVQEA
ncbi:hypothetical protein ACCO45_008522 [Purpureocillium lilacinum]|uniref:Uncharacterized protein n=1 Tax=Purpureocillium lilacinum TaxID=33203 RepID=A0ACC4DQX4_PURLI